MSKITQLEVMKWKQDPVTERLFRLLQEAKEISQENLFQGATLVSSEAAVRDTAIEVGIIRGLDICLNADLVDEKVEEDNE